MAQLSMYHSATGKQSPHCIHIVGLGKAGAQLIDSFLRTGEVEDLLADPRARFTALAVDIGEADMRQLQQYADSFYARLAERGIPADRAQIKTVALTVPTPQELADSLQRFPTFLGSEYPRFGGTPDHFAPWIETGTPFPTAEKRYAAQLEQPAENEHFPRALAKAIYGRAYYDGDRALYRELAEFARSIDDTKLPSMVLVAFGIGGGTGSGMVVDLARHLTNGQLGRRVPVIGVGVLPCTGDPEYQRGASVYTTLNDIDCMLDEAKNEQIVSIWGDMYKNPFTGGFLALPQQQSWERLHRYTTIKPGVRPEVRHRQAVHVTNKFVDDSFARYVVHDYGRELFRILRPAGFTGAPHERISYGDRNWTIFDVAKLMHPGVQVLPGEPIGKWRNAINDWIGYIPQWCGLRPGFKTEYIEAHTFAARAKWNATLQKKLEDTLSEFLLPGDSGTLRTTEGEFFDELTLYTNVIITGAAKADLTAFTEARDAYDALSPSERLTTHAWLLELGVMLSEPSEQFEGLCGKPLSGATGWKLDIPYAALRGDVTRFPTAVQLTTAAMEAPVQTVVPTP
ncbi:hypothetical protein Rwratislav_43736 [Rhodococcus wratislaviensis IFP 2016]|nr:hypothetical protein Rwratislav_43736 [Rhodococcus wratislaviensis IFP 2016]